MKLLRKKDSRKQTLTTKAYDTRYGNFIVRTMGDGQNRWIRVSTADGGWRMDFRDDTEKYLWITACLEDSSEGVQAAFESWLTLAYHMAHVWPDKEFLEESVAVFRNYGKRLSERKIEEEKENPQKDGE